MQYGLPNQGPPALVMVEVRQTGGAISKVEANKNAFSHRDAPLVLSVVGVTPTPEIYQQVRTYIDDFKAALETHILGIYPNFVEGHESHERAQDAFTRQKFERLMALKAKFDADNLFRFGYKIPPKSAALN